MENIPLFKPFMPKELPELFNILQSGSLSYGKWGKLFEAKISDYLGGVKVLAVNSYNSAVLTVLTTIGAQPGDEIIASPMSCLASNQPFVTQHLNIVWADIDPFTGTLDPESVKAKITAKTKAIFHNHYCGYPGYIDSINQIGKEFGILVIDDAIEAFGSEYNGQLIGSTGTDITIFSFQTVRLPNTIEGGALVFKNEELFNKAVLVRDYGINRTNFRDDLGEINYKCDINIPGYGATISEPNSYIGVCQFNYLNDLIGIQRRNAEKWEEKMHDFLTNYEILGKSYNKPNYWIYGILVPKKRDTILLFREKGFQSSSVHIPNNIYSIFNDTNNLLGVNEFYNKFIALPCGWWLDFD